MIKDMFNQMSLEGRSLVTLKLLNGQWDVFLVSSKVVHWKSCFLVNCGAQSITLSTIEHNRSQLGTIEHNTLLLSSCWTETRSCQFVTPQFFFFQLLINWWSTNGFLDHSFHPASWGVLTHLLQVRERCHVLFIFFSKPFFNFGPIINEF